MRKVTPRRAGMRWKLPAGLEMRMFKGRSRRDYIVFRTGSEVHVFMEVSAKEAATDCGAFDIKGKHSVPRWDEIWDGSSGPTTGS